MSIRTYTSRATAELRLAKLARDGIEGVLLKQDGRWLVDDDRPEAPETRFGRLMEAEEVVLAALSVDENAIKAYDIGQTWARPASAVLQRGD